MTTSGGPGHGSPHSHHDAAGPQAYLAILGREHGPKQHAGTGPMRTAPHTTATRHVRTRIDLRNGPTVLNQHAPNLASHDRCSRASSASSPQPENAARECARSAEPASLSRQAFPSGETSTKAAVRASVHADSGGDGPAVVLSHGYPMDASMFTPRSPRPRRSTG